MDDHCQNVASLDKAYSQCLTWRCQLPFDVSLFDPTAPVTEKYDIMEWISNKLYKGQTLYFPASRYKPTNKDAPFQATDDSDAFYRLRRDLENEAIKNGYSIMCNGSQGNKNTTVPQRIFICRHGRGYYCDKKGKRAGGPMRKRALHNDRRNSRGPEGLQMQRKTASVKAVNGSCCKLRFIIHYDIDLESFLLKGGVGNGQHTHHPKLQAHQIPTRMSLVARESIELMKEVHAARIPHAANRKIHHQVTGGQFLTRGQISKLMGKEDKMSGLENGSDTDNMFHYFRQENISYCALLHENPRSPPIDTAAKASSDVADVPHDELKQCEQTTAAHAADSTASEARRSQRARKPSSKAIESESFASSFPSLHTEAFVASVESTLAGGAKPAVDPTKEMFKGENQEAVDAYVKANRSACQLSDEQQLFLACAWTLPSEVRRFRLAPSVVHIDATEDTNSEKRPLLTFTGRDANGKVFTFLRVFLPNQQAWMFRWVFRVALVKLLGRDVLRQIRVVITDGDSQEITQLDLAIAVEMARTIRIRCGWHIVDRGWNSHGPKCSVKSGPKAKQWIAMKRCLKNWMFAWMAGDRSGVCETKEEYVVSKALFLSYIESDGFLAVFGMDSAATLRDFFVRYVEPHEDHFVLHTRMHIRHFDAYSNTVHEGTNKGMKNCSDPVGPQTSLRNAAITLSKQGMMNCLESERENGRAIVCSPLWSQLPCATDITPLALDLVSTEVELSSGYKCVRVSANEFRVIQSSRSECTGPIPVFRRVRRVTIDENGIMGCSCCLFERRGYGCRHMASVLRRLDPEWAGYRKEDIDLYWWKVYQEMGQRPGGQCQEALSILECRRPSGPQLKFEHLATVDVVVPIPPDFEILPAHACVANYSEDSVLSSLAKYGSNTSSAPASLQETYQPSSTNVAAQGDVEPSFPFELPADETPRNDQYDMYQEFKPLIAEWIKVWEGNLGRDDAKSFRSEFVDTITKWTAEGKEFSASRLSRKRPIGQAVSCASVPHHKKKTHGTKHFGK